MEDQTLDDLKDQMYVCFSEMIYIINAKTYWMKFGQKSSAGHVHEFYMPTPATYELLATDDTNFRELIQLSKYLEHHRSLACR